MASIIPVACACRCSEDLVDTHPRSGGSATFAKSLQSNAQATKLQMVQAYPNAQRLKLKSEICFSMFFCDSVVLVCTRT